MATVCLKDKTIEVPITWLNKNEISRTQLEMNTVNNDDINTNDLFSLDDSPKIGKVILQLTSEEFDILYEYTETKILKIENASLIMELLRAICHDDLEKLYLEIEDIVSKSKNYFIAQQIIRLYETCDIKYVLRFLEKLNDFLIDNLYKKSYN